MNKNSIIGTILIVLLFMGMSWYNMPSPEQREMQRRNDSIQQAQREAAALRASVTDESIAADSLAVMQDSSFIARRDSIKQALLVQKYGNLAAQAEGEEQIVVLENSKIRVEVSTLGGVPVSATLKEHSDYQGNLLELFNAKNSEINYTFYSIGGKYISTRDFYFLPVAKTDSTVTMRLASTDGGVIDFVYTLQSDSYLLGYRMDCKNLEQIISPTQPSMTMSWIQKLPRTELGRDFENRYSSLFYKYKGESPNDLSQAGNDDESLDGAMTWISYKNQFFSTMLITNDLFTAGKLFSSTIDERRDPMSLKEYKSELEFDVNLRGNASYPMCWFMGPNDYQLLSSLNDQASALVGGHDYEDLDLQHSIYLGWPIVRHINRWVIIPLFHLLNRFVSSYGIIILLLTLFIKLVTYPMVRKSYLASAKIRIAQQLPEVQEINEKYPNQEDAMAKQQAMMALYSRIGVNQMGGCVPMLIQWPVLIALFYFFPTSIELRHQPFLWADDLSTYDAFLTWDADIPVVNWIFGHHLSLFCILMTATNIFYTWLMQKQNPSQQSMPGMKLMMYFMPLMFLFFLNNYSAGLSYYYFLSTLIGILITYGIRWSLDEQKILKQFKENLKKPASATKASGWLARLQEVQRQQEAQLRKQREEQARRQRR